MRVAIYPGSFDPVTNGHLDIIEKSSKIFDKIIVAIVHNVSKKALFTPEERVTMVQESTKHLGNIEVDYFSGLLANYVGRKKACAIIRGLRTVGDFEYEMNMAMINKKLLPEVDTVFLLSDSQNTFVSSSIVKEVALLGGDIDGLVPEAIRERLAQKRV
ncbi:MAG: pantetheine-phosphate adenylyltransferase [Syntrophomonadaceae bacterium]